MRWRASYDSKAPFGDNNRVFGYMWYGIVYDVGRCSFSFYDHSFNGIHLIHAALVWCSIIFMTHHTKTYEHKHFTWISKAMKMFTIAIFASNFIRATFSLFTSAFHFSIWRSIEKPHNILSLIVLNIIGWSWHQLA